MPFTPSPFPHGAHVAAYLRDSGHEDQELSVDQQLAAITTWCAQNGLILTRTFIDAAAPGSSTLTRPAINQMIAHFRTPKIAETGIVIWKYNRFARSIDDAQYFKADLRRRGFILHSLNDIIPDGLDGRLFEAAIDWMNARFLADLSTDIKRGQRHILTQHGAIGGTPPRGFKREVIVIGSRRDGRPHTVSRWVPDPDTWDLCKLAWQMRAQGKSYREINAATQLYKSINAYPTFFRNRIYRGELVFQDVVIPDYVEPMIDQDTWYAVQALSVKERQAQSMRGFLPEDHPRRRSSNFLLSGLAYCARCGSALTGVVVSFNQTAGYRYEYYACSGYHRNRCTSLKIPRKDLETAVLNTIADYVLDPATSAHRQSLLLDEQSSRQAENAAQKVQLTQRLTAIRKQIDNITQAIADGANARSLTKKLAELEADETLVQTQLTTLRAGTPQLSNPDQVAQFAQDLKNLVTQDLPPETMRQILQGLIQRVTVERNDDAMTITGIVTYYHLTHPPPENQDFMSMFPPPPGAQ